MPGCIEHLGIHQFSQKLSEMCLPAAEPPPEVLPPIPDSLLLLHRGRGRGTPAKADQGAHWEHLVEQICVEHVLIGALMRQDEHLGYFRTSGTRFVTRAACYFCMPGSVRNAFSLSSSAAGSDELKLEGVVEVCLVEEKKVE